MKKGHFDQIDDFKAADDTIQINLAALKAFKVKGPKTSDVISKKGSDDGSASSTRTLNKSVGFDKIFKKGKLAEEVLHGRHEAPIRTDRTITSIYNKKNGFVYLDADGSGKARESKFSS